MVTLPQEFLALCRQLGDAQQRCSAAMQAQARQIEALTAEVVRLRGAVIVRDTRLALAQDELEQLRAASPGLPRRQAMARHIGLLAERLHLDLSQQGWVLSSEMSGTLLGCLLLSIPRRHPSGRGLYLAAAFAALMLNLLSAALDTLTNLILCRFACGIAAGLLYAGSISGLGRLPGQDRSYGLSLLIQTAVFALYATCLPQLAETPRPHGLGQLLAACVLDGHERCPPRAHRHP